MCQLKAPDGLVAAPIQAEGGPRSSAGAGDLTRLGVRTSPSALLPREDGAISVRENQVDFYLLFQKLGWPRSYLGKILFVSFLGVHVPLIATVGYLIATDDAPFTHALGIMIAMLVATLVGTGATLACLYALLAPVRAAAEAMNAYLRDRTVPRLPTSGGDEAGRLLANVQEGVTRLDAALDAAETRLGLIQQDARDKFGLLAAMSHELRTPLNHVVGFSEILASNALGPIGDTAYRDYAAGISSSSHQLVSVIQNMLDLSETVAGDQGLAPQQVMLADAVNAASARVHLKAQATGTAIHVAVSNGLKVHADPRALKQILLHALIAAAETAGTGGHVRVTGYAQGGAALVEIAHDGTAWTADDVPAELRSDLPALAPSAAKTGPEAIRYATAQALRLSLIRSMLRASGGSLKIAVGPRGGRVLRLGVPGSDGVRLQAAE